MQRTLLIQPRDPVIFRDGKPFTQGLPARSVNWPLPSAVIGPIRTRLAREIGYDPDTVGRLIRIEHIGPFLAVKKEGKYTLAFPAPADAVAFAMRKHENAVKVHALRPARLTGREGIDTPDSLCPLLGGREEKTVEPPPFWSAPTTLRWLQECNPPPRVRLRKRLGFDSLQRQRRIHLEVLPDTLAARKGALFSTEGLEFPGCAICSRIRYADGERWASLESLAPLGGERRLAYWSEADIAWPTPPDWLEKAVFVRLQLITPGYFSEGWRPQWLKSGTPPGLDGLKLELISAAVPRAMAHSGWDLTKPGKHGEKPTRFLAPAGSVYFCKVIQGDPRRLWMRSICDDPQFGRDGFGLVLCGVWKWQ